MSQAPGATPAAPGAPAVGEPTTPESSAAVYHKHGHCWWPQGDVGKLRAVATAWSTLATAIDRVATDGDGAIVTLRSSSGPAIEKVATYWSSTYSNGTCATEAVEGGPALTNLAATCRSLSESCDTYANAIERARKEVIALTAAATGALVIGAALTFVTFGASDAAAAGAEAAIVAEAAAAETTLASTLAGALTRIGITAAKAALAGAAYDALIVQPIQMHFEPGREFSWRDVAGAAEFGAIAGGALGGFGEAGGPLAGRIAQGLGAGSGRIGPALGQTIRQSAAALDTPIGRALSGGAVAAGMDKATTGEVNPIDVALGLVGGLATSRGTSSVGGGRGHAPVETEMPGTLREPAADGSTAPAVAGGRPTLGEIPEDRAPAAGSTPAENSTEHSSEVDPTAERGDETPGATAAEQQADAGTQNSAQPLESEYATYEKLGDVPWKVDFDQNDQLYGTGGAHTLERHGSDVPLYQHENPGGRTLEGRIYGDPPWQQSANFSYRWVSNRTMRDTVNQYVQANWEKIRSDLALDGYHAHAFDAGHLTGEGFFNRTYGAPGAPDAAYGQTSYVEIRIKLVPGADPPQPYIVTAYPRALPPGFRLQ
ncbi:hypothetical protein [Frankia sp. R82]|uniref:WXG100-like domain-containing protein n=1 Tax=Frankia sp. R82 TaxID=2950553 RepID=UPI002043A2BC|nr:hypothetical protein [Frankia sp. R82]MCM3883411.1 hypothetical protein [Frankia sp. R82]